MKKVPVSSFPTALEPFDGRMYLVKADGIIMQGYWANGCHWYCGGHDEFDSYYYDPDDVTHYWELPRCEP